MSAPVRGTRRRVTRAALPLALLTAGVGLTGCGTDLSVSAAVVDGEVISDSQVQAVATEINAGMESVLPEPMTGQQVLYPLIIADAVEEVTTANGAGVSNDEARQVLEGMEDPSDDALRYIRTNLAVQSSPEDVRAEIVEAVQALDVEVSPRYGEWDAEQLALVASTPNWIEDTAEQDQPGSQ